MLGTKTGQESVANGSEVSFKALRHYQGWYKCRKLQFYTEFSLLHTYCSKGDKTDFRKGGARAIAAGLLPVAVPCRRGARMRSMQPCIIIPYLG